MPDQTKKALETASTLASIGSVVGLISAAGLVAPGLMAFALGASALGAGLKLFSPGKKKDTQGSTKTKQGE